MKISFRNAAIVSAVAVGSAYCANKCIKLSDSAQEITENFVKMQHPARYEEIMNSPQRHNPDVWKKALDEIGDTLENLNRDARNGHFRLNPLLRLK